MRMLGIEDFWGKISTKMSDNTKEEIQKRLDKIAKRRNQIVHEADVPRKIKTKKIIFRKIKKNAVGLDLAWIEKFVGAIESVCKDNPPT